jgi:hypothetical protein
MFLSHVTVAQIAARHNQTGGSTTHAETGKLPSIGFAVSAHKDREYRLPGRIISPRDVARYARKHESVLSLPDRYLGTWYDQSTDQTYLDCVAVLPTEQEALALARLIGERFIYCLHTATELAVEEAGTLAA